MELKFSRLAFLSSYVLCHAKALADRPGIERIIEEDTSLTVKNVTYISHCAYLGEILDAWTKQTGINLSASERDGAATVSITIHVQNIPLSDAMEALWSLLSYNVSPWWWERIGSKGKYSYVLHQSKTAYELSEKISKERKGDFKRYISNILDNLDEKYKNTDSRDDLHLKSKENYMGLRALKESISPDQWESLLSGQTNRITVNSLGDESRKFLNSSVDQLKKLNPNQSFRTDKFVVHMQDVDASPTLFILFEDEKGGLGGAGYLGGDPFKKKWSTHLAGGWFFRGDMRSHPILEERGTVEGEGTTTPRATEQRKRFQERAKSEADQTKQKDFFWRQSKEEHLRWVYRAGECADVPIIARLEMRKKTETDMIPASSGQGKISYMLNEMSGRGTWYKWRKGILLCTSESIFTNPIQNYKSVVPWSIIKEIHRVQNETKETEDSYGDGTAKWDFFAKLSQKISFEEAEFLYHVENPSMQPIFYFYEIFQACEKDKTLLGRLKNEGISFDEAKEILTKPYTFISSAQRMADIRKTKLTRVRLAEMNEKSTRNPENRRIWYLVYLNASNEPVLESGAGQTRR